jgi:hypothetical protein
LKALLIAYDQSLLSAEKATVKEGLHRQRSSVLGASVIA